MRIWLHLLVIQQEPIHEPERVSSADCETMCNWECGEGKVGSRVCVGGRNKEIRKRKVWGEKAGGGRGCEPAKSQVERWKYALRSSRIECDWWMVSVNYLSELQRSIFLSCNYWWAPRGGCYRKSFSPRSLILLRSLPWVRKGPQNSNCRFLLSIPGRISKSITSRGWSWNLKIGDQRFPPGAEARRHRALSGSRVDRYITISSLRRGSVNLTPLLRLPSTGILDSTGFHHFSRNELIALWQNALSSHSPCDLKLRRFLRATDGR